MIHSTLLPSTPTITRARRVERFEALVVGAGQAGLAVGHHLASHGVDFAILDGDERVGDTWRRRWDSLRLFTPAAHSGLPGMPFPAPPTHLPDRDEVADYMERYAERFELPVRLGTRVDSLAWELIAAVESLSTAAHGAGFADAAHLTRTSRSMFGVPPSLMIMMGARAAREEHVEHVEG